MGTHGCQKMTGIFLVVCDGKWHSYSTMLLACSVTDCHPKMEIPWPLTLGPQVCLWECVWSFQRPINLEKICSGLQKAKRGRLQIYFPWQWLSLNQTWGEISDSSNNLKVDISELSWTGHLTWSCLEPDGNRVLRSVFIEGRGCLLNVTLFG